MIYGAHFSVAGGVINALHTAERLKVNALQFFIRSPRNYHQKDIEEEDVQAFRAKRAALGIRHAAVHAVYLQNLASAKDAFHKKSIESNVADIIEASRLGADSYILHLGSHKDIPLSQGIDRVVKGLKSITAEIPEGVNVLLENVSGAKNLVGSDFAMLAEILDRCGRPRNIGICIDTCHAWCCGYDIASPEGLDTFASSVHATVGLDSVKLIHVNDTKDECGSKNDRHANIGQGKIGAEGIGRFINHASFRNQVFILETPVEEDDLYVTDLDLLRKLRV
jgi:deoxyribonuclease-4